jgi:hypothetical protein
MLLRVSGEHSGTKLDLSAVTKEGAADTGVRKGAVLLTLAEAIVSRDPDAITRAAASARSALGDAGWVHAVAVAANFERMVRIADGTGIPLDEFMHEASAPVRNQLGLARFPGAAQTRE